MGQLGDINVGLDFTFRVDLDHTSDQFKFVALGTDGYLDLCTGAAGEGFVGALQENPKGDVTKTTAAVRTGGVSKVFAGGTLHPGDYVTSDSNGKAVAYTKATVFTGTPYIVSGSSVYGQCVDEGNISSGQVASILVNAQGLHN